jgi:hypothetical protein
VVNLHSSRFSLRGAGRFGFPHSLRRPLRLRRASHTRKRMGRGGEGVDLGQRFLQFPILVVSAAQFLQVLLPFLTGPTRSTTRSRERGWAVPHS